MAKSKADFVKEIKAPEATGSEPIIIKGSSNMPVKAAPEEIKPLDYTSLEEMLYKATQHAQPKEWVEVTKLLKDWMGKSVYDRGSIKLLKRELKTIANNGQLLIHSNYLGLCLPHYQEVAPDPKRNERDAVPTQYRNLDNTPISAARVR